MKRVIIVSYYYSPANIIGAVRASKLSKYLHRLGYEVNVICSEDNKLLFYPGEIKEDKTLINDTKYIAKTVISHSVAYKSFARTLMKVSMKLLKSNSGTGAVDSQNGKSSGFRKMIKNVLHFCLFVVSLLQDYDFLRQTRKHLKTNKLECDVVISTYGPIASHLVGKYIRKNYRHSKWVADFRDPIAQPTNGYLEYQINKSIEASICKNADIVTAVSNGYLNEVTSSSRSVESYVITNGFDTDDLQFSGESSNDGVFSFVYTGTTYGGRRDVTPIFESLAGLIHEGLIDKRYVKFRYAGNEVGQIIKQARKFNLDDIVESYGFLPRRDALALQAKSTFLVVSTWNEQQHEGVLPGKFLEYMLFKKPIISIVNGDVSGSEIGKIIDEYQLGICYETVNANDDLKQLQDYLYMQYCSFASTGNIQFKAVKEKIEKHNYQNIADQFDKIISKL